MQMARALVKCVMCGTRRIVDLAPEEGFVINWSGLETHKRYCPICRGYTPHQLLGFDLGF